MTRTATPMTQTATPSRTYKLCLWQLWNVAGSVLMVGSFGAAEVAAYQCLQTLLREKTLQEVIRPYTSVLPPLQYTLVLENHSQ